MGISLVLLLAAAWFSFVSLDTWAQTSEYQLKARFLPYFAASVKWPLETLPEADTPIRIGVLGDDPFGESLEEAFNKEKEKAGLKRNVTIARSRRVEDLKSCHLVFISKSEKDRIAQILSSFKGVSILTVGETEQFARRGGMINYRMQGNKVRFEINPDAAARVHLKISSDLLDLAEIVTEEQRTEPR